MYLLWNNIDINSFIKKNMLEFIKVLVMQCNSKAKFYRDINKELSRLAFKLNNVF